MSENIRKAINNKEAAPTKRKRQKLSRSSRPFDKQSNIAATAKKNSSDKLRLDIAKILTGHIISNDWRQVAAAKNLDITQPRVSNLMNHQIEKFSADKLITILERVGFEFKIRYRFNRDKKFSLIDNINEPLRQQSVEIVNAYIAHMGWTSQEEVARNLGISQPRVSNLTSVKVEKFSLEFILSLIASKGFPVTIDEEKTNNGTDKKTYFISVDEERLQTEQ